MADHPRISDNFSVDDFLHYQTWILDDNRKSYRPSRRRAERFQYWLQNPDGPGIKNNPQDRKIKHQAFTDWEIDGGTLYRRGTRQQVVFSDEVFDIVAREHETLSHAGRDKLFKELKRRYYTITKEECLEIVKRCRFCRHRAGLDEGSVE